jgi:hypothetical protein
MRVSHAEQIFAQDDRGYGQIQFAADRLSESGVSVGKGPKARSWRGLTPSLIGDGFKFRQDQAVDPQVFPIEITQSAESALPR